MITGVVVKPENKGSTSVRRSRHGKVDVLSWR
jgi:hypothetical protein